MTGTENYEQGLKESKRKLFKTLLFRFELDSFSSSAFVSHKHSSYLFVHRTVRVIIVRWVLSCQNCVRLLEKCGTKIMKPK